MKGVVFIFVLLCTGIGFCQNQKLIPTVLISKPLIAEIFIGFDGLGNYYYINNSVFTKQNNSKIWEYKNVAYGKITAVDIINPLKIVLFYENFNVIITLDNQLNEIQKINLSDGNNNAIIASRIGMASKNQFWIFNTLNQQIGLFDYLKNTYNPLGQPIQETIKFSQSDFNYFSWIDSKNRLYSCDIFGKINYITTVPQFDTFQIIDNNNFIFSKDKKLFVKNEITQTISEIQIVEKSFKNFYYKDQILAIFTNQVITNYKITIP